MQCNEEVYLIDWNCILEYCDMETQDLCGWTVTRGSSAEWKWASGKTGDSNAAVVDHTFGIYQNQY